MKRQLITLCWQGVTNHKKLSDVALYICTWASAEGGRGPWPPWIFIHNANKVEGGLMVLFFGLVFSVASPENFSVDALDSITLILQGTVQIKKFTVLIAF